VKDGSMTRAFARIAATALVVAAFWPVAAAAQDRSEKAVDLELTEKVRQVIAADDSFSTKAKNVSVDTVDGIVTLRGPVPNEQERNAIAAKVRGVAGVKELDDKLEFSSR
jgi:hyperosmotically inducible periplasmic protein